MQSGFARWVSAAMCGPPAQRAEGRKAPRGATLRGTAVTIYKWGCRLVGDHGALRARWKAGMWNLLAPVGGALKRQQQASLVRKPPFRRHP